MPSPNRADINHRIQSWLHTIPPSPKPPHPPPRPKPPRPPYPPPDRPRSLKTRLRSDDRLDRSESAHLPLSLSRPPSQLRKLSAIPSDLGLGLGIERVVSDHFGIIRNDSVEGRVQGLKFTFQSLQSYGHSSTSVGDDPNPLVGGVYANIWGSWTGLSGVRETAGALYRSDNVDECFVLERRLGAGACSEVRLGLCKKTGNHVAIKVVAKASNHLFWMGECREVMAFRALLKLQDGRGDGGVVQCHGVFEDDRFVYIVMELLQGGQLLPRVADRDRYPSYCENDVVTLVRAITRALANLHNVAIAHRDVKPENILYASQSRDPTVKLVDFGISQPCSEHQANDMVGTPLYVAPEVLLRQPYGIAADMWSLGVIVHILLTGYPPFDDDDLVKLVNKVKTRTPKLDGEEWQAVTSNAHHFVTNLLERDVSRRMTAGDALAHPWLTTPRPPPFPAPPMPLGHARTPKTPPPRPIEGCKPLVAAQCNLQQFFTRREFKRRESVNSDCNMKLSMLVSLSEKDLNISESAKLLDTHETPCVKIKTQRPIPDRVETIVTSHHLLAANRIEELHLQQQTPSPGDAAKKKKKKKSRHRRKVSDASPPPSSSLAKSLHSPPPQEAVETSTVSRDDPELEHQLEQERLRQHRLRVEAELSRKKRIKARHSKDISERTVSFSSSDSISSRFTDSEEPHEPDPLMLTNSKFSEDISLLNMETFPSRRDADAHQDAGTIHKQRDGEHKTIGARLGRRSRHSNTRPVVREKKQSKGVRIMRRHKNVLPLRSGNKMVDP